MSRVRPHAKIHTSIRYHQKTAAIWTDPVLRGMYVELLRIATERYAGRTKNGCILSSQDLCYVTGCDRASGAVQRIQKLVRYIGKDGELDLRSNSVSPLTLTWLSPDPQLTRTRRAPEWHLSIPNFERKQGFTGKEPDTSDSDSDSNSHTDIREEPAPETGTAQTACEKEEPELVLTPTEPSQPSAHARFVAFWCKEYERVHGLKYRFVRGKDGKLVKEMLATYGEDKLSRSRITRSALAYLENKDDDLAAKSGWSLGVFVQFRLQGLMLKEIGADEVEQTKKKRQEQQELDRASRHLEDISGGITETMPS